MNGFCTEDLYADVCANCYTRVVCIDGKAYKEGCEFQSETNPSYCRQDKEAFQGKAVCYPQDYDSCDCTRLTGEAEEFNVDFYGSDEFFVCPTDGASTIPQLYQCPTDETFDESKDQCVKDDLIMECRESGSVPLYPNCISFLKCVSTASSFFRKVYTCEDSSHFWNPETSQCEDPCTWNLATPFICTDEGRFPDPYNCNKYHECVPNVAEETGLEDRVVHCPNGLIWDGECRLPGDNEEYDVPLQTKCDPLPSCSSESSKIKTDKTISYLINFYLYRLFRIYK